MAGTRDKNLRSGDLHEDLGLFMLKAIALVAPVPRTEDVGVDAFATLLRRTCTRQLSAEESFTVQIKASSTRVISYSSPAEVAWLSRLEIPLFICSVELANAHISLYTTHRLFQVLLEEPHESVNLHLDLINDINVDSTVRSVYLGPPVLSWSLPKQVDIAFLENVYYVMAQHIRILRQDIALCELKQTPLIQWETNELPVCNEGTFMLIGPSDANTSNSFKAMVPALKLFVVDNVIKEKKYGSLSTVISFFDMMRRYEVEPDPNNLLIQMALHSAGGEEISEAEMIRLRSAAFPGQLDLTGTDISDESLQYVPEEVEMLCLRKTSISDGAIKYLVKLPNLKRLNLASTSITDKFIYEISDLKKLRRINLSDTQVTKKAVEELHHTLPSLEIILY